MIVSGLHSRAECPTALHLLHSRNGHEPDFCRWPGVLHSAQYFEQFPLPLRHWHYCVHKSGFAGASWLFGTIIWRVAMRIGTAMIANHALTVRMRVGISSL